LYDRNLQRKTNKIHVSPSSLAHFHITNGSRECSSRSGKKNRPSVPEAKNGVSRWWHYGLAQKDYIENLMTKSAQTKKKN